jgi:uncharacterized protein (TIGR01777 family)
MKKIVIAGGTGFLGNCLARHYEANGWEVIILTRGAARQRGAVQYVSWDGKNPGPWVTTLEGADVVVNLNGRSVDCRYTEENKRLIYSSRLDATAILGAAIQRAKTPPKVWLNAASATIYRYAEDREMDEYTGETGTGFSVDVCQKWEAVFNSVETPETRKILLRTGIVLGHQGGPLRPLKMMARLGAGGKQGSGNQYCSWLHETDFVQIVDFLVRHLETTGVYNVTAPVPVTNKLFMRTLRRATGMPVGIPLPAWLLAIGARLIQTEAELILKSRRVVPARLLQAGYRFRFPTIEQALQDLC